MYAQMPLIDFRDQSFSYAASSRFATNLAVFPERLACRNRHRCRAARLPALTSGVLSRSVLKKIRSGRGDVSPVEQGDGPQNGLDTKRQTRP